MIESAYRGFTVEQRYLHYVPALSRGFKTEEDAHRAIDGLHRAEGEKSKPARPALKAV